MTFVLIVDRGSLRFWREMVEDRSEKYEFICCIGDCVGTENICVFFYLLCIWPRHNILYPSINISHVLCDTSKQYLIVCAKALYECKKGLFYDMRLST